MIYRLQKRFILISALSVLFVIAMIFAIMAVVNVTSMNSTLDTLADSISKGGGDFPDGFGDRVPQHGGERPSGGFDIITPETKFSTRHFTVWFDKDGGLLEVNTDAIYSVSDSASEKYAREVIASGRERGWYLSYRYKVFTSGEGNVGVVFVDGNMNRIMTYRTLSQLLCILLASGIVILALIVIFSKKAMTPVAESYEKQKRFITDANHELKTPLTLILANLDIAEAELGKNEWLDDMRSEGERMTELVNQLVALSRMDEEESRAELREAELSEIVSEAAAEFEHLAGKKGKRLICDVSPGVTARVDEALVGRLVSILLDNAVKYCDEGGEISVRLEKRRHAVLTVENSYSAVDELEFDRLFDRFYRADKARTYSGGFGIGLSTAKAIAERHGAQICAYKAGCASVGFRVSFKG